MFCYQCQETKKNIECTKEGFCGKQASTAALQDVLVYVAKGIAVVCSKAQRVPQEAARFIETALFSTITNVNFSDERLESLIETGLVLRDKLKPQLCVFGDLPDCVIWSPNGAGDYYLKAPEVGILATPDENIRSLRELLLYGLKGVAAYAQHASLLGRNDDQANLVIAELLAATVEPLSVDELVGKVMQCGELAVTVLAMLDEANTSTYGHPEITKVSLGVGINPGILVSGHDLIDLEALLKQTAGKGIDIYTHGEMLPAHYYPKFKQYPHLKGNYGGAWWAQKKEFEAFNGPILMTTNCLMPPRDSYKERVFTTGNVGFDGLTHISPNIDGEKDFSPLIAMALDCAAPTSLEDGEIIGGFGHDQVMAVADKVVDAVKSGAIKRFVVMAGCDGAHKSREYFTDVAEGLPEDAVILTAGCAKYRYNKLDLGDIGGIPRVLDAGQCNDSYSLAVIALKLQQAFELEDINDLPISFDLGWYEQKAVAVLLGLLHLGVKGIRLGPTLPAFLSPDVANVLVDNFDIKPITTPKADIECMMVGA
tara:strand:- start:3548 stop:5164 length:1617 start_codon:yes stop_codon:yes gene_type:complete